MINSRDRYGFLKIPLDAPKMQYQERAVHPGSCAVCGQPIFVGDAINIVFRSGVRTAEHAEHTK